MEKERPIDRHVLFTNLQFVRYNDVRFYCAALLLSETKDLFGRGRRREVRGFGTDPALPVFDLRVDSIDFTSASAESADQFIGHEGVARPLVTGMILKLHDGPSLQLLAQETDRPICVDRFEGDGKICEVWEKLSHRVRQFWHAPNFPVVSFVPFHRLPPPRAW